MSLNHSPSVITNGLVYYHDMNNTKKSWKGAPTTNLQIYSNSFSKWSKSSGISSIVDNAGLSPSGKNDASLVTANGVAGSFIASNANSQTAGITYTRSVYAKAGTTSTLVFEWYDDNGSGGVGFYQTTFNLNNGTVSFSASGNNGSIVPVDGYPGWYRCIVTRTITLSGTFGTFYIGAYGVGSGNLYLYGAQTEVGSYATPLVITNGVSLSRSNTAVLIDLTGNNTITANSLTYSSNNDFSFNGSSNSINCGNASTISSITGTSNVTVESWVKYVAYGGGTQAYSVITHKGFPWAWLMENPSNIPRIRFFLSVSGDIACSDSSTHQLNTWYNFVGTYDGTNIKFYRNGILTNTVAATGTVGGSGLNMIIGSYNNNYFMNGSIPIVKIYNRTLSAAEIKQNFNALRGRFGL